MEEYSKKNEKKYFKEQREYATYKSIVNEIFIVEIQIDWKAENVVFLYSIL